jgi:hypothetical protein
MVINVSLSCNYNTARCNYMDRVPLAVPRAHTAGSDCNLTSQSLLGLAVAAQSAGESGPVGHGTLRPVTLEPSTQAPPAAGAAVTVPVSLTVTVRPGGW